MKFSICEDVRHCAKQFYSDIIIINIKDWTL
jgi:hypothetical protein